MLGPRREGALVDDPYVHYAAAIQKLYEDTAAGLVTQYLYPVLKESGKLAFAGTSAINIKLNNRLESLPSVQEFYVHPACGDAGTAIGAASYALSQIGLQICPMKNVFLGPKYTKMQCISACRSHREKPQWEELEDAPRRAAELIAKGNVVAWFQGRMEFGPRALGNRSILGNPSLEETSSMLNKRIKFRDQWRPYCPSLLDTFAKEFLDTESLPQYMQTTVAVKNKWRTKFPNVVYADGTVRPQVVTHDANPRFYQLLKYLQEMTGHGIVLNTALNRPGEALACSPEDALDILVGSELDYLIMEDILVTKREVTDSW